jgi:hypothetical protein
MANVAVHDEHSAAPAEHVDFDSPAKSGWVFFSKFLLWNVISCIAILLFIGLLTVWS